MQEMPTVILNNSIISLLDPGLVLYSMVWDFTL